MSRDHPASASARAFKPEVTSGPSAPRDSPQRVPEGGPDGLNAPVHDQHILPSVNGSRDRIQDPNRAGEDHLG